ncbi:MAG: ribonuclease R [Clostridia bacterium]|nr:ribonuclease R [Clostridia bacterium]
MDIREKRKKTILEFMKSDSYVPLTIKEIALMMDVPSEDRLELEEILNELIKNNDINLTKKGRYVINANKVTYFGKIEGSKRGFSFFVADDKNIKDVYVPFENLNGAMHKDQVELKILQKAQKDKKSVGEVIRIVKRENTTITGIVEKSNQYFMVRPFDRKTNTIDIDSPPRGLKSGDIVVARVTDTKKGGMYLSGEIVEIIGSYENNESYIKAIIIESGYTLEYPQEAVAQAIKLKNHAFSDSDYKARKDFRNITTITIDGEDAKDLDDAISISQKDNGNYLLGVHIADVSHYVTNGTPLDEEALLRGNSVYLVDTVIPMLPEQLSNDICSLNPQVDRLSFSVTMEVDRNGEVKDFEIAESVINVNERMTYKKVQMILDGDAEQRKRYSNILNEIDMMNDLCDCLTAKRKRRGSIDFNFKESKIIVDEKKNPIKITQYDMDKSNKIIEEFMILCNETVAQQYSWLNWPFIYRIHEKPDDSKIDSLNDFVKGLGLSIKTRNEIHPQILQDLVESVRGTKLEHLINTITLRALKKAKYSPYNVGHFGLASEYYCHFTSPIRRYPDLMIHRLIKDQLKGKDISKNYDSLVNELDEISISCSDTERKAEMVERDVTDLYKAIYMEQHVGDIFRGVISGVMQFGLFVELENTVEGLIKIDDLEGYFNFDKENYRLYKEKSNFSYTLGELVEVKIQSVNIPLREINMRMVRKIKS